ncbi:hypothetical protein B0G57_101244 [Trinickia symbiotica]|uniref:Uncharacterized protein n=2 Tax=Trinickia symbiotica TaxID=863227 RepID=A0A2N7X9L4_9BURK|nr:hypothetical protein [Trinickia symbiotica]PMS38290.1 hypothetical protein C0Z20_04470 [Trinickia symbiotica]PPK47279.1 hypothetical protein B0G57_101244 [Trinickia symbiotica]
MDGFVRHRIEGVSVDVEVIPAAPQGFTARFRIFGDAGDEPDWHAVHLTQGPFSTRRQAEEAAKSAALTRILEHGSQGH